MLSRVKKALLTASIATGIVTQPACKPRAMDPGETLEAGEKLIKEDLISNPVSVNFDRFVNVSRRTKVERLSTDETIEIMNKNNLTALKRKDFPVLDGLLKKLEKDLELPEIIVFTNNFGFPNPSNELEFSSIPKTEKDNDRFINKLVLHIGKNTLENIEAGRLTIDVVYGALSHEIGHIITQIDPEKKEVNYKKATVLDYARAARLYAEDEELSDLASACIAGPSAMIATLRRLFQAGCAENTH